MTAKRFLHEDDKTELQTNIEAVEKVASDASRVAQDAATIAHEAYSPTNKPTASDVGAVARQESLSTSILEKALTLSSGIHHFRLSGGAYTGGDLPTTSYRYCSATVHVRQATSILVILHGTNPGIYTQTNYYDGSVWTGWTPYFLPLDGSVPMLNNLFLINASWRNNHPQSRALLEQTSGGVVGVYNEENGSVYSGFRLQPITANQTDFTDVAQFRVKNNIVNDSYALYGEHNVTCGTADITAGTTALTTGCYYDVYK